MNPVSRMSGQDMEKAEQILGYRFRNRGLLQQAFTRESYSNEAKQANLSVQSNEVLEFCGDSILGAAVITLLMRSCATLAEDGLRTRLNQGDFSVIKSNLTSKHMLAERMHLTGLHTLLLSGEGDRHLGILQTDSVAEDLLESLIGAVYFDCGQSLEPVIGVVERLLDVGTYLTAHTTPSGPRMAVSAKNSVQEFCDKHKLSHRYEEVSVSGPDHDRHYVCACLVDMPGKPLRTQGEGKSRKAAELQAAAAMYALLCDAMPLSE